MRYIFNLTILLLCGCTLFRKDFEENELQKMTESVLKNKEGVEIQIKPINEKIPVKQ